MWMRCTIGQVWRNGTCEGIGKKYDGDEILDSRGKNFNFADFEDWYIPDINELETLVYCSNGEPNNFGSGYDSGIGCNGVPGKDYDKPVIEKSVFPNSPAYIWSRTVAVLDTYMTPIIDFDKSAIQIIDDTSKRAYIRLVRKNYICQ